MPLISRLFVVWCCLVVLPLSSVAGEAKSMTPKQQMAAHTADLRALMLTLYDIYPAELAKSTKVSPREFTEWVFEGKANWNFEAVRRLQGKAALALWDDPDYQSDLILPMIIGLETLLFQAYDAANEFQIPETVTSEKLEKVSCELRGFALSLPAQADNVRLEHLFAQQEGLTHIQATLDVVLNRIEAHNAVDIAQCIQN